MTEKIVAPAALDEGTTLDPEHAGRLERLKGALLGKAYLGNQMERIRYSQHNQTRNISKAYLTFLMARNL